MAVSRLCSKYMKCYETGADTSKIEDMLAVVFNTCLEEDAFFDLPIDGICKIVAKKNEHLSMKEADTLVSKLTDKKGQEAAKILSVLDIGPVGYFDAASTISPLRICPIIRELLDARPVTARTGGDIRQLEKKIQELEKKNAELKKENEENKRKLRAKADAGPNKDLEEKLFLLLPDEKDIVEAAENGNLKAVQYYAKVKPKSINLENEEGYSPLQIACLNSHDDVAEFLIKNGADVNHSHKKGDTALHFAALGGSLPIVELLLASGAKLDAVDSSQMNALNYAAQGGNIEIVKFLVEKGLDPLREADGTTNVWFAAYSGDVETFAYFIDLNIDKEKPNKMGETPLHAAAMSGNVDIADVLIDFGLDPHAKSLTGSTPLDVATEDEMIEFLQGIEFGGEDTDEEE